MPLVLGVTGSIATGKSYLCTYLVEKYGAIHADADKVVHRMYDPGKPGFDRIVAEFGEEVIGADGYIDRKLIGSKVFGNQERMSALTRAIGDIAGEMHNVINAWRAELGPDQIAILEAVNLMEAGYSEWCDATWLVGADYEVALPRLMTRNNFSEAEARQRLDAARTWQQREPASDRLFMNNTTLADLEQSADRSIAETLAMFKAGTLPRSRWHAWWEATREEREAARRAREAKAAQDVQKQQG
ncbi:dephospho-CoA kinase [Sediminibacterium sp.]|uniref:dephospho-CoA kinase n=1 Tax=Sediminibacterium sp. TaxID=1917865 RepID=UPI002732BC5A|nr:dephospho-CoA kinase [Sediminibacterium sp.]MDP3566027.1 dephospho-CoA kinase [Sediminibacterium sp.]